MQTNKAAKKLWTINEIARELNQPANRIRYCVVVRLGIEPIQKCGNVQIYGEDALGLVKQDLKQIKPWPDSLRKAREAATSAA